MKLSRKVFLLTCILASTIILPTESFADPSVSLGGTTAAPLASGSIGLTSLVPGIIYTVTCSLTVTGAASGSTNTVGSIGLYCSSGPGCEFKKPTLSNFSIVGPKNNIDTYQVAINNTGTTTLFDKEVETISPTNLLLFINLDNTATLNVANCTAVPVTTNSAIKNQ